ncbi:multidrug efflux SMR transporter [Martelella alba]|uniref:Multidrug efflux SMR transporter n=1 Tax=Martelella alba TaxID=2590451 RepID=A0A506UGW8_9HYPH|nr:multidrug efflux SMR transporter [Martelella alba]TPW32629.1 multidrug efflux SMR transporter [Martelella alba]
MNPVLVAYGALAVAIISEVIGSTLLQKSEGFTRLLPTLGVAVFYIIAFFLLSQALKAIPLGVAYAIWAGLGIVLTAAISVVYLRQPLDLAGMIGIAMIVGGVVVMNLFSTTAGH